MFRLAIALIVSLVLSACASAPPGEPGGGAGAGEKPLDTEGVIEHGVSNEAVAMLWAEAEDARAEGDTQGAIRAIERALEVDPEDPVLWSRLAELRLQAGEVEAAEKLAARSNSLSSGQRLLRYRNWLIIEAARREQGDDDGADAARAEAERVRGGR